MPAFINNITIVQIPSSDALASLVNSDNNYGWRRLKNTGDNFIQCYISKCHPVCIPHLYCTWKPHVVKSAMPINQSINQPIIIYIAPLKGSSFESLSSHHVLASHSLTVACGYVALRCETVTQYPCCVGSASEE